MTVETPAIDQDKLMAFVGQAVGELGATVNAGLIVIGDRLGLYRAMAGAGPLSSGELADRTGTTERYVREWLNAQAAGGYVDYDAATSRYSLSTEKALVLADESSPAFVGGAFQLALGTLKATAAQKILTQAWSPMGGITSYRGDGHSTFDDPVIAQVAAEHGKTPAQVMLRWHLQEGRSAIPKSVNPERIAANFDVFDFELTEDQIKALDGLNTGVRGGPEPETVTPEAFGRDIPEA